MEDELEKLLAEEKETPTPASSEAPKEPTEEEKKLIEEEQKKQSHLDNIKKAIDEANAELRKKRKALKIPYSEEEEEELPQIDMKDPSSKAWDKHIRESVNPLAETFEKGREEIRTFALREFLKDKPALAGNKEKLQKVVETYEKIKTASETNKEGVLMDLEKAYVAENYDVLLRAARNKELSKAQSDAIFSDIAVSRGSTSYSTPKETVPHLDEDSKAILAKWGMSPAEWLEQKKKFG